MTGEVKSNALPTWPVLVALGLVAALIVAMIALDLRQAREISSETDAIVENSQRALVLLDRIRSRGEDLHRTEITEPERARLNQEIAGLAGEYASLPTYPGERDEWARVQELLAGLATADLADHVLRRRLARDLNSAVDRLVSMKYIESRAFAARVHEIYEHAIKFDLVTGAVALTIVTMISVVLIRLLRGQRRLAAAHLEALAEKNRDLEDFAGRAAHNLRSPMNPIRGYADLIVEAKDSPGEVDQMARRIRTAVDRMARVVDDMLALSVAGRPPAGVCSTTDVTTGVLEELGPELLGVNVTTSLTAGSAACSADVLDQILRSLIGNALKYRERTRPLTLEIETRDVGATVELVVQDNGIGMDAETAARAFEPLFRGRTDRDVPGHGLGLAIVERTTRALGGTCAVTSVLDEGTRIAVTVPRA